VEIDSIGLAISRIGLEWKMKGPFAIQAASTSGSRYEKCFMCNQDILKSLGLAAHIREKHSELVN
jgi:hypothetical protein